TSRIASAACTARTTSGWRVSRRSTTPRTSSGSTRTSRRRRSASYTGAAARAPRGSPVLFVLLPQEPDGEDDEAADWHDDREEDDHVDPRGAGAEKHGPTLD